MSRPTLRAGASDRVHPPVQQLRLLVPEPFAGRCGILPCPGGARCRLALRVQLYQSQRPFNTNGR